MTPTSETQNSRDLKIVTMMGTGKRSLDLLEFCFLFIYLDYGSLFCLHIGHIQVSTADWISAVKIVLGFWPSFLNSDSPFPICSSFGAILDIFWFCDQLHHTIHVVKSFRIFLHFTTPTQAHPTSPHPHTKAPFYLLQGGLTYVMPEETEQQFPT